MAATARMSPTALVGLTWTESYKCSATKHRFQAACPLPSSVRGEGAKGGISGARLHGGASGSGGPPGNRNGQYRHGERTKAAIAERQKFSALLKMLSDQIRRAVRLMICQATFCRRLHQPRRSPRMVVCSMRDFCATLNRAVITSSARLMSTRRGVQKMRAANYSAVRSV